MNAVAWGAVIVAFITAASAIVVALISRSSNKVTAGSSAGELALKLAQDSAGNATRLEARVVELETWQRAVRAWYRNDQDTWDQIVDKLEQLSPGTKAQIHRTPMPD